ncbi:MAG: amidohydrolase family protein [Pseudohongiellaceae bacterium]
MKTLTRTALLATLLAYGPTLPAQDLTVVNARIITTDATVIDNGHIVVRGGRIATVAAGAPAALSGSVVDAAGLTALPGFIDAHRHFNTGPNEREEMQAFLEAGYTTLLSGGGPADGNLVLRDRIERGEINGPRILPSGRVSLAQTEEQARAEVRSLAAQGVQFTGEITLTSFPGPSEQELRVLRAILDEAGKVGVLVQVHAVSHQSTMAAVEAGVPLLVHVTNKNFLSREMAERMAASGVKVLSTVGFGSPVFGIYADDNVPRFRNGEPWPSSIPATSRVPELDLGQEAGHAPVNARTLWDAGVVLGYCTDTQYAPLAGLAHELKILSVMFSPRDLLKMLGPNTASYIQRGDDLGELSAGKLADIILLDGDPLAGYWEWLTTQVVIKEGRVVVDKR